MSVVVDSPVFGPSTMDKVAPLTEAKVSMLLTFPRNEKVVVGLGDAEGAEGDVVVPLLPLQAHVQPNITSRTTQPRLTLGMSAFSAQA